jgi:hypothetical protein
MRNKARTITERTVDFSTGEVITEKSISQFKTESEPAFVKVYINNIANKLHGIKNTDIFLHLLRYMDYENRIIITKSRRTNICSFCSIKEPRFNQVLADIVDAKLFTRINKGEYMVDPNLFGRGRWSDILKMMDQFEEISYTVTINKDGEETITTSLGEIDE